VIAWILLWAGVTAAVAASVAALFSGGLYRRLHFLASVTSISGPLVGLALVVDNGWSLTSALVVLTIVLLGVTGPVLSAATARVVAQRDGIVEDESPS
jgi:multisubunit Na+/H+ antiporter MnhG subunit